MPGGARRGPGPGGPGGPGGPTSFTSFTFLGPLLTNMQVSGVRYKRASSPGFLGSINFDKGQTTRTIQVRGLLGSDQTRTRPRQTASYPDHWSDPGPGLVRPTQTTGGVA